MVPSAIQPMCQERLRIIHNDPYRQSIGLVTCNQGKEPTFVRGASESHIDLTFATRAVTCQISGWKVIDEESLSLHRYIEYTIGKKRTRDLQQARRGWAIRKLNRTKLEELLKANLTRMQREHATKQLIG